MFVLYSLLLQLAARIYKRSVLQWKDGFVSATLGFVLVVAGAVTNVAAGLLISPQIGFAVALALHIALGGWFLGPRVKTKDGVAVAFASGVYVSGITYGLLLLIALLVVILNQLFGRGQA